MDWGLKRLKGKSYIVSIVSPEMLDKHLCKHEPPYVIEDLLEMELCRMKKRELQ